MRALASLVLAFAAANGAAVAQERMYHIHFYEAARCAYAVCAQWTVCEYAGPEAECQARWIDRVDVAIAPRPRDVAALRTELGRGCWLVTGRMIEGRPYRADLGEGPPGRRVITFRIADIAGPDPLHFAPETCARS